MRTQRQRSSRRCLGMVALLVPLLPVTSWAERAAMEGALWLGGDVAWLGNSRFSATGQRTQDGQRATFAATGQQLGFVRPALVVVGASMSVLPLPYLSLGLEGRGSAYGWADQAPGRPDLAAQLDPGGFSSFRFGGNVTGILPLGRFSLRLGATLSYNHVGVPVTSFDKEPCGKGGLSRCYPSAGFDRFALEPRLSATMPLSSGGILNLLVTIATDLVPPSGLSCAAGLLVHLGATDKTRRR